MGPADGNTMANRAAGLLSLLQRSQCEGSIMNMRVKAVTLHRFSKLCRTEQQLCPSRRYFRAPEARLAAAAHACVDNFDALP